MLHLSRPLAPFSHCPLLVAICLGLLGGCSSEAMRIPEPLIVQEQKQDVDVMQDGRDVSEGTARDTKSKGPTSSSTPAPVSTPRSGTVDKSDRLVLDDSDAAIKVNVEDVALPAFINEVFGNILSVPFEIDNALKGRSDRVTLRLEQPQTKQMVYNVASQVMANYGVEMIKQGSVLRFQIKQIGLSPDEPPILITGDARPDVPIAYRPVFQFVPLHNVDPKDVIPWLSSAYEKSGLVATADGPRGGLMLKGMASIVSQAAEAVRLLDQPFMRGQYSLRIDPAFITSESMAKQLKTLLGAQGYSASIGEASGNIVLVPLESSNGLIVFSNQSSLLGLVREWAAQVDRIPLAGTVDGGEGSDNEGLFFYEVRNTRATELGKSLRALVSGLSPGGGAYGLTSDLGSSASRRAEAASPPSIRPAPQRGTNDMGGKGASVSPLLQLAGTQALLGGGNNNLLDTLASSVAGSGTIVEDENRNAILFRGPGRVWQQMQPLIRQLDRPARQVLIEVTVASVDLSNLDKVGVSWDFLSGSAKGRETDFARQISGGGAGFTYMINTAGGTKATLTALASDTRTRILATPRILVKSGEQANINVGTDIPIVTGQQADNSSNNGTSNVLQSISYRSTGVILNVSPVVYSNNRVDLTVSQEVSNSSGSGSTDGAGGNENLTPQISRTSLETALTLQSGGSIFMGGLIRDNSEDGVGGVPILKDIPMIGYLFGARSTNTSRSEVVMLIQPYVIEGASDAKEITDKLRRMIDPLLSCTKAPGACG
ncbi:type II secretion system protein GspD [Pseudomonas sp. Milli4]|uniref:Type II secretion system protein GspD n=2 Tax=Pseudomonas schmalbachii TaxID=2816993 RepID=A0ABS3TLQ1_9PSED|nr:type II secretion system protein GspD [Pseudomonas schmalbachii]